MNDLYSYFKKINDDDKLVHSYLIGNTRFDDIKEELYKIFESFFLKNTNIIDNPDLYILKNEKGNISKEEIKDLIKIVNNTSQFNNVKIYVIDECEKLNDYSCNALLKTLEEPGSNVYAFLITENIDSVKPTIASRCQKIFISSEIKNDDFDNEIIDLGNELIDIIDNKSFKEIYSHTEIYNKIIDKDVFKKVLLFIQSKFIDDLNKMVYNNLSLNNEFELLSKKILVINNAIDLAEYNLNKNLFIDRFIIEMWRCCNENS